jgi:hypothetical protein
MEGDLVGAQRKGSVTGRSGSRFQIAGDWFVSRISSWTTGNLSTGILIALETSHAIHIDTIDSTIRSILKTVVESHASFGRSSATWMLERASSATSTVFLQPL